MARYPAFRSSPTGAAEFRTQNIAAEDRPGEGNKIGDMYNMHIRIRGKAFVSTETHIVCIPVTSRKLTPWLDMKCRPSQAS